MAEENKREGNKEEVNTRDCEQSLQLGMLHDDEQEEEHKGETNKG